MKKYYTLLAGAMLLAHAQTQAQTKIGGTGAPDASAMLEVTAGAGNNKGILLPRLTTAQRDAMTLPATGLMIYNTTANQLQVNTGTPAAPIWTISSNSNVWSTNGNNGTNPATNFLGTINNQPVVIRTNNAERMRIDSTTGNVGINDGTPRAPLSFASITGSKIRLWDNNTDTLVYGFGISNASLNYIVENSGSAAHRFWAGGDNANGTELMRIQSNGSVGIGTATPTAKLDIRSADFGAYSGLRLVDNDGTNALDANMTPGYDMNIATAGSFTFDIGGIGYWIFGDHVIPGVNGMDLGRTDRRWNYYGQNADLTGTARIEGSAGTPTTITGRDASGNVGNVALGTGLSLAGGVLSAAAQGWGLTGNAGTDPAINYIGTTDAQPLVLRTSAAERVRITSSGNVGIGNNAPLAPLSFTNTTGPKIRLYDNGTDTLTYGFGISNASLNYIVENSGSAAHRFWAGGNNANGTEIMTIQANGNVGIGNNTPRAPLSFASTVGSKIRLWDDGTDTATYGFGIGSAALNYHIDHNPNGAHRFIAGGSNGDGTELMRIQSNGNVGIGNGGPLSPLSFASITGPKIALYDNGSATEHYGFGVSGGQLNYHTMTGGSHMFYIGGKNGDGTELMRIQGDGNVGIGTTAPTAKLHVNGTARIAGSAGTPTAITGRDASGNIGNITLGSNLNLSGGVLSAAVPAAGWGLTGNAGTNPANNFVGTTDGQPLVFRTNGTEKMRIAPNGFVGIGPTLPGCRLQLVSDGLGGGSTDDIVLASYGPTATSVLPTFFFQAGTGTAASPGNTANNTTMGSVQFNAFVNGALATQSAITSNYTGNGLTHGANLVFLTRQAGDASFVQQMIITPAGDVGIGTLTPSYELDVLGDINASASVRANGVVLTSDARLKRNINETKHGLSTVMALNPVEYEKKNSITSSDYNRHEIGFIAQEVAKVLPGLVTEGKDADKTLAVSYTELIPVLTKAIQELKTQVDDLKAENNSLKDYKASTAQLMERVKQMEQMMGIKEIEAGAKVAGK